MIFVINLARRPERLEKWKFAAHKNGINEYTRWEAVDGAQLKITPEIQQVFPDKIYFYFPGVMGCALSHYYLWQHIVETNLPYAVVFEDDAIFFQKPFSIPDLPSGWELFYFGGFNVPNLPISGTPVKDNIIIPKPDYGIGQGSYCTYAYMISNEGAKKLCQRVQRLGIQKPIDAFMVDAFEELHVYACSPFLVFSDPTMGSDVQDIISPEKIYVINKADRPEDMAAWKDPARSWQVPFYERWNAIDEEKFDVQPGLKLLFHGGHFTRQMMARSLNHYLIWENIVQKQYQQVVIFEDAAHFFLEPFRIPTLPRGWDLFYFGGLDTKYPEIEKILKLNVIIPKKTEGLCFRAYAYMLSLEGAKKLYHRAQQKGFDKPLDNILMDAWDELNVFCLKNFCVKA